MMRNLRLRGPQGFAGGGGVARLRIVLANASVSVAPGGPSAGPASLCARELNPAVLLSVQVFGAVAASSWARAASSSRARAPYIRAGRTSVGVAGISLKLG